MEGTVYSNLGSKLNKSNRAFREKLDEEILTLKDFLEHKWTLHSAEELKTTFIRELKAALKKDNIFDLINSFFELEQDLHQALNSVDFEISFNFDEFYKNVSPLLLRSVLENSNHPDDAHAILKSIKESLRIALEEELYRIEDLKF